MVFKVYKRGQGKYTRLCSAFAGGVIAGFGCWRLFELISAMEWGLSQRAALWVNTMVPAGIFVVLALLIYWLMNKPSIADFMIAAEGELKKVSWSSRSEIVVSTIVVICVVISMAVLLGFVDLIFSWFFDKIL